MDEKVVGAPAIVPFFWNLIKNWFDPVTTAKIFILSSSQVLPTLTKHIDPSNLPRKYGGTLNWEFGQLSDLDEHTRRILCGASADTPVTAAGTAVDAGAANGSSESKDSPPAQALMPGPILWQAPRAVAVGSIDGKDRRSVIGVPGSGGDAADASAPTTDALLAATTATTAVPNGALETPAATRDPAAPVHTTTTATDAAPEATSQATAAPAPAASGAAAVSDSVTPVDGASPTATTSTAKVHEPLTTAPATTITNGA